MPGAIVEFAVLELDHARLEAHRAHGLQPVVRGVEAEHMPVHLCTKGAVGMAQQVHVVREVLRVERVGVPAPFQEPQRTVLAVMPAGECLGPRGFERVVRSEECSSPGLAVHEGGGHRQPQVLDRRHVVNCVVNEHAIELATQAHRAHVAMNVHAFRVHTPALREHLL